MRYAKRWILIFFIIIAVAMPCYMAVNYIVDPMCYFAVDKGTTYYRGSKYGRAVKAKYMLKNAGEIDAVVLGGSKSGAIDVYKLSDLTGLHYYNYYMESGNFSDYLTYAKFLIERCKVKEITFHISSFEVMNYSLDFRESDMWRVPAVVDGNLLDKGLENLKFLVTDTATLWEAVKSNRSESDSDLVADGMKNWEWAERKLAEDPEGWVQKEFYDKLPFGLNVLFGDENWVDDPHYEENLNALAEIKRLCDEHGVTLKVVIGASLIAERFRYEQDPYDRYYDYLRSIVRIAGGVWDFSSFNDINMNPYNFYNFTHYSKAVADLQVDVMYGLEEPGQYNGFGVYLTMDNIDEYLRQRKADYLRLKDEYLQTGTVAAKGLDDPSNLTVKVDHTAESETETELQEEGL